MDAAAPQAEIREMILHQLAEGHTADAVTTLVSERYQLHWSTAQTLVLTLQAEQADEITLRQAPLLVLLAIVSFFGGLGLAGYSLLSLRNLLTGPLQTGPEVLPFYQLLIHSPEIFEGLGAGLLSGLAMMTGSLLGMKPVWAAVFAWVEAQL